MGEEAWRVHRAGAPSLDHLRRRTLLPREELETKLQLDLSAPLILVAYHPVTLAHDTTEEAGALFAALKETPGQLIFCYPNADAGSRSLIERTREFLAARGHGQIFTNLDAVTYRSLLRQLYMLVGNSSSGIMETPSFAPPTVNVGMRQQGRERAANIMDAAAEKTAILGAMHRAGSQQFRDSLHGMENPYGDGHASEKIVDVLTTMPLGRELLIKHSVSVDEMECVARKAVP